MWCETDWSEKSEGGGAKRSADRAGTCPVVPRTYVDSTTCTADRRPSGHCQVRRYCSHSLLLFFRVGTHSGMAFLNRSDVRRCRGDSPDALCTAGGRRYANVMNPDDAKHTRNIFTNDRCCFDFSKSPPDDDDRRVRGAHRTVRRLACGEELTRVMGAVSSVCLRDRFTRK